MRIIYSTNPPTHPVYKHIKTIFCRTPLIEQKQEQETDGEQQKLWINKLSLN